MAYQYKVVEVREKMIGGKISGDKVEKLLNEYGAQGWELEKVMLDQNLHREKDGHVLLFKRWTEG